MNTAEFVADLKKGSKEAFDHLADRMFKPLWRFLVHHMGIREPDAEEIVQDTLLKVHSSVQRFKRTGRARFTTWVVEIARNLAIDFHRADRPSEPFEEENFVREAQRRELPSQDRLLLHWLRDELAQFPAEDQQILLWRAHDRSYKEIGTWLGIKEGTARVRHKRLKDRIIEEANRADLHGSMALQDVRASGVVYE
ncbi:MAG: sigma-70 family RNA polymerase sigma factor [Terracidiphilus sp.]